MKSIADFDSLILTIHHSIWIAVMRLHQKALLLVFLLTFGVVVGSLILYPFRKYLNVYILGFFLLVVFPSLWFFANQVVEFDRKCPHCGKDLLRPTSYSPTRTPDRLAIWVSVKGKKLLRVDNLIYPFCLCCHHCHETV